MKLVFSLIAIVEGSLYLYLSIINEYAGNSRLFNIKRSVENQPTEMHLTLWKYPFETIYYGTPRSRVSYFFHTLPRAFIFDTKRGRGNVRSVVITKDKLGDMVETLY